MTFSASSPHDFVIHDTSRFPLVRLHLRRFVAGFARQWLSELESLVGAGRPFVLLVEGGDEAQELYGDRKQALLWFRRNRGAFGKLCRGIVGIEVAPIKRALLHARALVLSPIRGVPATAAASQVEAETIAARLLTVNNAPRADFITFFRGWASHPIRVASIVPSGNALSALFTSEITPQTGPVLELGPGTGVFTRALLDRGIQENDLTLVEFGTEFAELLQMRYPNARVLCMDAQRLASQHLYEGRPLGAVISGLPLLNMRPRRVMAILGGAFAYLRPGGSFFQFTYGPACPVPRVVLDRLGLKAVRVGRTLRNLPPGGSLSHLAAAEMRCGLHKCITQRTLLAHDSRRL